MQTAYILNPENQICRTEGPWDEFALQNDGAEAIEDKVVGHSIWNFTVGFEVQSFLNAVFFFVRRSGAMFETKYRCDSSDSQRLFSMAVSPIADGGVRVDHELLRQFEPQPAGKLAVLEHHRCFNRCSMCCHFKVGNEWIDPFATPEEAFFPKSHTICPSCKNSARESLGIIIDFPRHSRSE
ncbi:hypothetical protein [Shimia sagamensis]|uniref:Uncharacterized protein n=1 Tax=Shimia sagamensis TaxID=1566352 RepID=A0ABY1NMX9_9RHOB|nr:hypothetical protein [Shimia sagamensis]SMP13438.1 hypothetical protein SAMN06265373_102494 [Shimia sagamensis]